MDPAILADGTDNFRRGGDPVGETRATTPAFPPGRYGRRRDGRRHLTVPLLVLTVVLVASVLFAVRLYRQYGDPDYDAQIVGWTDVADTRMTIRFTVRVPAGGSATCGLRARDYDGAEVGRRTVTVSATGDETLVSASEVVPTTAKASVGEVVRCAAAG
jgi:Domain of unknown function (DUF4307)